VRILALIVLAGACTVEAPAAEPYAWDLPRGFPAPSVPKGNPMSSDKVELGRHLFHDTRLSGNGTQSCASCHAQERAFTDGLVTSIGSTGAHGRHNAMSLANVAYNSAQTWANPNVVDLESQALIPMFGTAPVELGVTEEVMLARLRAAPIYADMFARAFPDEPITVANTARAIASFERTILSGGSRFDRFSAGDRTALSPSEQNGLALFESPTLGCRNCHDGFNLSSATERVQMFNTGLYNPYPSTDRGLAEITGLTSDTGRFKPPTLRNIALTAPYMHDGSVATLDDVVEIYAHGGRGDGAAVPFRSPLVTGFVISAEQRADVVAFLGALTDDGLAANPGLGSPIAPAR
jgi:cytochrome c peroxidase